MSEKESKGKKYLKSHGLLLPSGSIGTVRQTGKILENMRENIEFLLGKNDTVYIVIDKEKENVHLNFCITRESKTYKIYNL